MENTDKRKTENIKANTEKQTASAARRDSYNSLGGHTASSRVGLRELQGVHADSHERENAYLRREGYIQRGAEIQKRTEPRKEETQRKAERRDQGRDTKRGNIVKKKKLGFARFLAIYSAVFLAVIALGLVIFWNFISAYENSRHEHIIKEFLGTVTEAQVAELLGDEPLCGFESAAMICDYIRERALDMSFRCIKIADRYTDETPIYSVTASGSTVATVTLSSAEKGAGFGFDMYTVTGLTVGACDGERVTVTVTAPKDASLDVNGYTDLSAYVKEEIAYPRASIWESDTAGLPLMTVYEIPGFVLLPEISAYDGEELLPEVSEYDGKIDVFFDLHESKRHTIELTVPEGSDVTLGGVLLTEEQITERGIAYESYADTPFNRAAGEFPAYCRYTVSGLVSEPARTVQLGEWKLFSASESTEDGITRATYAQTAASMYRAEIHAPSSAEVFVNGIVLDSTYLEENGAVYEEIADLTDYISSPISEQVYLVDMLYAPPMVEIAQADGTRITLTEEDGAYRVGNPVDDTVKEEHVELVERVITKYVEYTAAGYTDTDRSRFLAIRDCSWDGSPAYNSITDSRHSFAQNIPCTIRSLTVESYDYKIWGENSFSCTVDFTAELTNFRNVTDRVEGVTLYFAQDGESWKLIKMLLS